MSLYRIVEIAAWSAGALLLATYVGVRTWSAQASDAGVKAMQQARAQHAALLAQAAPAAATSELSGNALQAAAPDTSLWDSKRIAEYKETLRLTSMPEGVLRIPKFDLQVPVYEGTSDLTLNRGAGRIAGTAAIDSTTGNIGIAAHRDGFFRPLKDIKVGDTMFIDTVAATREYQVKSVDIVEPSDVSVLRPTADSSLTLVTCYPFYFVGSAPKRFIVKAQLMQESVAHDE